MKIHTDTLPCGLRLLHVETRSDVMYCGAFVFAGTRDERPDEHGMAHLMEHMLFKGTERRNAMQINERLEGVGGELNAYTCKEETVVYAAGLKRHFARAYDLICDLVFHSRIDPEALSKERSVVMDEIDSDRDDPADLIADDFEDLVFQGSSLGRNILGTKQGLRSIQAQRLRGFYRRCYTPNRIVLFSMGAATFDKVRSWAEAGTYNLPAGRYEGVSDVLPVYQPAWKRLVKHTSQMHCQLGTRAFSANDPQRTALLLLNNILGGPSMNSRLNAQLREKHGLVYAIESQYTAYTDTGLWALYFGADHADEEQALSLIRHELDKLMDQPLSSSALHRAQVQYLAQLTLAAENRENWLLAVAKHYALWNEVEPQGRLAERIRAVTALQMQSVAQQLFAPQQLTGLCYV